MFTTTTSFASTMFNIYSLFFIFFPYNFQYWIESWRDSFTFDSYNKAQNLQPFIKPTCGIIPLATIHSVKIWICSWRLSQPPFLTVTEIDSRFEILWNISQDYAFKSIYSSLTVVPLLICCLNKLLYKWMWTKVPHWQNMRMRLSTQ